jgi:hypothetical protein
MGYKEKSPTDGCDNWPLYNRPYRRFHRTLTAFFEHIIFFCALRKIRIRLLAFVQPALEDFKDQLVF